MTGVAVTGTDTRDAYVQKRRKRYLAQVLESFEENIEKHLPPEQAGAVQDFKGLVRQRFNALAVDAIDLMTLSDKGEIQNALAQETRDSLHPTGRP